MRHPRGTQTLAHLFDIEALCIPARNQAEHRGVEAVRREHRPAVRIHTEEAAYDAAQRAEIELMQRQPLAEQAALGQAILDGCEVLYRVERSRSAACRMEVVGDDHVITIARGTGETPCIRGQ